MLVPKIKVSVPKLQRAITQEVNQIILKVSISSLFNPQGLLSPKTFVRIGALNNSLTNQKQESA